MDTLLYTFALIFGLSARSPNVTPNPFDYEVSSGVEYALEWPAVKHSVNAWGWTERENGDKYVGLDTRTTVSILRAYTELQAGFQNRQAQGILRGDAVVSAIILKYGRLGVSNSWDHLEHAVSAYAGIEHKYLSAAVNVYRDGLESARVSAQYPIRLFDSAFVLEPQARYMIDREGNQSYQGKLVFKIQGGNAGGAE